MNGWAIFGIVVGCIVVIAIVGGVVFNLKDIQRYLRIRSM